MPTANPPPLTQHLTMDHSDMHSYHQQHQQPHQQPQSQPQQHQQYHGQRWRSTRTPSPPSVHGSHTHSHHPSHPYYQQHPVHHDRAKKDMEHYQMHHHQQHNQHNQHHHQQQQHHGDRSDQPYHNHNHHTHYDSRPSYHQPSSSSSPSNSVSSHSNHYEPSSNGYYSSPAESRSSQHAPSHPSDSQQSMHAADTLLMLSAAAFMDSAAVESALNESRDAGDARDAKDIRDTREPRNDKLPPLSPTSSSAPQPHQHHHHHQHSSTHHQSGPGHSGHGYHSKPLPLQTPSIDRPDGPSLTGRHVSSSSVPPLSSEPKKLENHDHHRPLREEELERGEGHKEEDDEEEEDEVMSEGVVHVNSSLAPFSLSPRPKSNPSAQSYFPQSSSSSYSAGHHHVPPPISTSLPYQDHPGSPLKTPTTPRGRASKQRSSKSKSSRPSKRSQSDSINGHGKNTFADASSSPFLFSPFQPACSPSSASALSPLSFHAQLQMLTHNFVSIQPHSSPTNRFRRTPSAFASTSSTPPFSPPVSPGLDLTRDASLIPSSGSANTSPTKQYGSFTSSHARPTGTHRTLFKPRWHTQPYMMFLALRAMPLRTAARQELIMAAVELDKKFSAEKGLPRVFTGKTPMNSASACLTNNGDKYFIPFKPEGSRSTHFRLAFQPCDFDTALQEYNSWMEKLASQDWPMCFGVPKDGVKLEQSHMDVQYEEEARSPTGTKRRLGRELEEDEKDGSLKKAKAEEDEDDDAPQQQDELRFFDKLEKMGIHSAPSTPCTTVPPVLYTNEAPVFESKHMVNHYRLDELDLSRVPSSLSDIVRVDTSTIPNAGNGLFAKVDLPASTPLGFYFGVPMSENEFDSLKDGVGLSSQYSIMYRRTVLDATDETGLPYSDPNGPLYCPFHFMNEDPNGNVSFITGSVENQVICTTNREIKAGEELLVFYGKEADRHWALQTSTPVNNESEKDNSARSGSKSRTTSPTRDSSRPRRETVFKPARYTR